MNDGSRKSYVTAGSSARLFARTQGSPAFSRLDIELTERCNNACVHCYINLPADDPGARQRELSTRRWQELLDEAAELGVVALRVTGGEPLLREDFAEIYLYARRHGFVVVLYTNACLVSAETAAMLAATPPLAPVEVSVYGMTEASYEAVTRRRGSFADFRRGVELLLGHGVAFRVKGALLPMNEKDVPAFEAWAATLPGMDGPPAYSMCFDLRARRDSEAKNRAIDRLRVKPERVIDILSARRDAYVQEMRHFSKRFMGPQGDDLFPCGAGCGGCIDSYGVLQPCMLVRHPAVTHDLRNGSLKDGLRRMAARVRSAKVADDDYLASCARCFLGGLCEHCPGKAWADHGTLDTRVEYFCSVAHAQARDLGLLADGERAWEVADWRERLGKL